jgi:hypothetical protein
LAIGTEVSAKYKGAFCEARIQKVQRLVKCRVTFRNSLGAAVITDDNIKGALRVGATIEAKHPDKNLYYEANISKIIDASLYTVVFDDGDVTTLRRTSLCLKSGKHFSESESLDHLPLTNPEHFGNPVSLRARGTRKRRRRSVYGNPTLSDNEDADSYDGLASGGSVDDEDSNTNSLQKSTKDELEDGERRDPDCGKLICVDYGDKRSTKLKDGWFPALIVHPSAQDNNSKIDIKEDHLVKSFINGRFYQLPRKDAKEFTKEIATQTLNDSSASSTLKSAVEKALLYIEKDELPSNWDYDLLIGSSASNEPTEDGNISSDLEFLLEDDDNDDDCKTNEEKDRFVAQLYKFMDERGTPINKTPNVGGKDLDLYNLYRLVSKLGGYNRVTNKNGWKAIYNKLNLPNNSEPILGESNHNQLKLAYKKFLLNFVDFYRKLGCTMVNTCLFSNSRTSARTARSERNWRTTSESKETPKMRKKKPSGPEGKEPVEKEEDKLVEKSTILLEDDDKSQSSKKNVKRPRKNARKKYKLIDMDDSSVNGNEPEEKYIPGDSDSESDAEYQSKTPTIAKEVSVVIGDRIRVKYGKGKQLKVYEAKVLKINHEHDDPLKYQYFVHYTGWNIRYDEWIKRSRIVEVVKDKSPKRRGGAKTKNKGVPLPADEPKDDKDAPGKEAKDGSSSKRNRSSATATPTKPDKMSKEDKIRRELERKLVAQQLKRTRQRSDCTEIASDNDELPEALDDPTVANVSIKVEPSESIDDDPSDSTNPTKVEETDRISLDDFEADKDESPEAEINETPMTTLSSETSDSNSKPIESEMLAIKKELIDSIDCSEPSIDSSNSYTSTCDQIETKEPETTESVAVKCDRPSDCSKKLLTTKMVDVDEVQSSNGPLEMSLPCESETSSLDEDLANKSKCQFPSSSKSSSTCSSKSDEDTHRKRKTRTNKIEREATVARSDLPISTIKKKSVVGSVALSNDAEEEDAFIGNENVDVMAVKRKRFGNRSVSECERSEVKGTKRQRSTSESEPPTNVALTLDTSRTSVALVTTEPEVEPSGSADIGVASFLLCKEEIPASPVCDLNEDADPAKHKSGKEPIAVNSDKTSNGPASTHASNAPQSERPTDTSAAELPIDATSAPTTMTLIKSPPTPDSRIAAEVSDETTDRIDRCTPSESIKRTDAPAKESIGEPDSCDGRKSKSAECSEHDEPTTKAEVDSDPSDSRKANEENIATHLDGSALSSPRKKRRGRVRDVSHCETGVSSSTGTNSSGLATVASNGTASHAATHTLVKEASKEASVKELRGGCKTRGSMSRRVKHNSSNSGGAADANHSEHHVPHALLDTNDPLSPSLLSSSLPAHFEYQPISKYNFCTPLDDQLDSEKRIQILQERLQEVRKTYLHIKAEVGSLDRKRKKLKRKERSSPSSPGSSSQHSDQKGGSCSTKDSHRSQSNSDASGAEETIGKDENGAESIGCSHRTTVDDASRIDQSAMLPSLVTVLKAGEILSERV